MKKYFAVLIAALFMFGGVMNVYALDPDVDGAPAGDVTGDDCDEECQKNIELETEKNPKTGSFLPYAIVVGGITFSVAAIYLAKKNNKLYQV